MSVNLFQDKPVFKAGAAPFRALRYSPWALPFLVMIVSIILLLAVYFDTVKSMIAIWRRSETFAHGFLIFPVSVYLIWRHRSLIAKEIPAPDYRGLIVLAGLGFSWLLARLVDVLVLQQLCLVGMIPVLVWTVLGWNVVKHIVFPLGFLFFAVPMGEFLIPPLMNFTADFAVRMIELSGIPIYREGTFFSIPSGDWSVVEGCSGLRYLIASITIGCLYAYLTYRSLWRRLAFIGLAILFPIIANGLRAYMIVMIAHFSDMKLALGVDHYIYGWVFFGIVMLLMFWIGSFWREAEKIPLESKAFAGAPPKAPARALCIAAVMAVAIVAIWPVRAAYLADSAAKRGVPIASLDLKAPSALAPWEETSQPLADWEPHYTGFDAKAKAAYQNGERAIGLHLLYYRTQKQGAELINSQNVLIPQKHPIWKMPEEKPVEIRLNGRRVKVLQGRLHSAGQKFLVWRWNWVSGVYTSNEYWAKFLEAKDKLLNAPQDGAAIVIMTRYEEGTRAAAAALQNFVDQMFPAIARSLQQASQS